jgi:pseudouridine synthase
MTLVRVQKILADAGVASRRQSERFIASGKVIVNGKVIRELGFKADPDRDHIRVDGKPVPRPAPKVYYAVYKPRGVITSLKDPEGRPTIGDIVPHLRTKLFPVGRLDYDAEGLLLLTNDGDLSAKLTHPRYRVPRTYMVKIKGELTSGDLVRLERGDIGLEDGMSPPMKVSPSKKLTKNSWLKVTVREGRNRVIKRTLAALGHPVLHLKRINYGGVAVGGLKAGDCRPLSEEELARLRRWG